jgi:DNA-binding transcriptional LysR family regulator
MRHLKAFHIFNIAAESSSFSEAADKLCVTHGAVSKQIKTLENFLSLNLFHRQGRNVHLTHEGRLLKNYTTQAFQTLNSGVQELTQQKNQCLEISCEPTLTMRWLMPRMSDFYDNNPNTDVRLSTAGGPVILGSSGLSLAIRREDFELTQDYKKTSLVDEWVGPVFSPYYWQQIKHDFSLVKLIHSETRPNAWLNWHNKSANKLNYLSNKTSGKSSLLNNPSQTFAHFYFCYQAVIDGLGSAIGSYPLVADDIKRGNLIAPFGFGLSGHSYILLSQNVKANNSLEEKFILWVQSQLEQCVPSEAEGLLS